MDFLLTFCWYFILSSVLLIEAFVWILFLKKFLWNYLAYFLNTILFFTDLQIRILTFVIIYMKISFWNGLDHWGQPTIRYDARPCLCTYKAWCSLQKRHQKRDEEKGKNRFLFPRIFYLFILTIMMIFLALIFVKVANADMGLKKKLKPIIEIPIHFVLWWNYSKM